MIWWHVEDGVARAYADSREVRARVDTERDWYGCIEGCITHGGVRATAYKRRRVMTYHADKWLETGEWIEAGEITETEITAVRD